MAVAVAVAAMEAAEAAAAAMVVEEVAVAEGIVEVTVVPTETETVAAIVGVSGGRRLIPIVRWLFPTYLQISLQLSTNADNQASAMQVVGYLRPLLTKNEEITSQDLCC